VRRGFRDLTARHMFNNFISATAVSREGVEDGGTTQQSGKNYMYTYDAVLRSEVRIGGDRHGDVSGSRTVRYTIGATQARLDADVG
jgi:hypothetical protein